MSLLDRERRDLADVEGSIWRMADRIERTTALVAAARPERRPVTERLMMLSAMENGLAALTALSDVSRDSIDRLEAAERRLITRQ